MKINIRPPKNTKLKLLKKNLKKNTTMSSVKDLETPLISASSDEHECRVNIDLDTLLDADENPYRFIGSDGYEVPEPSTVDPFRNHTPKAEGVYEWVKIIVCVPIALVRLVLFGLCLCVGYVATKSALNGWKDKHNPMPKWRCRVMWITRLCTRGILFAFG